MHAMFSPKASGEAVRQTVNEQPDELLTLAASASGREWKNLFKNLKMASLWMSLWESEHQVFRERLHATMLASKHFDVHQELLKHLRGHELEASYAPLFNTALQGDPGNRVLPGVCGAIARMTDGGACKEALGLHVQSPFIATAHAARATLARLGAPVSEPYRYEGLGTPSINAKGSKPAGLETIATALEKLEGSVRRVSPPKELPQFWSLKTRQYWSKVDPEGTVTELSELGWSLVQGMSLPAKQYTMKRFSQPVRVFFEAGGEPADWTNAHGTRHLLVPFASDENQFNYCINLHGGTDVYSIDHDGTGPAYLGPLDKFLRGLKPVKERAPKKAQKGALKAEVRVFGADASEYAARWLSLGPDHQLVWTGPEDRVVEIARGQVGRQGHGVYMTDAFVAGEKLVLYGQERIGVWEGKDTTVHKLPAELAVMRAVACDAEQMLLVSNDCRQGLAVVMGLDGSLRERRGEPDQYVVADEQRAYFVKVSESAVEVTAWDGRSTSSLGCLALDAPLDIGAFGPSLKARSGKVLLQDNRLRVSVFGDGEPRQLDVRVGNAVLTDSGFVGAKADAMAWNFDGSVAWEYKLPQENMRHVHASDLIAFYAGRRIAVLDMRDGTSVYDGELKLTSAETIKEIVPTADGAIVVIERHRGEPKCAYWVARGKAPVTLAHPDVAGALPFGQRMATWAGQRSSALELHVWDIAAPG